MARLFVDYSGKENVHTWGGVLERGGVACERVGGTLRMQPGLSGERAAIRAGRAWLKGKGIEATVCSDEQHSAKKEGAQHVPKAHGETFTQLAHHEARRWHGKQSKKEGAGPGLGGLPSGWRVEASETRAVGRLIRPDGRWTVLPKKLDEKTLGACTLLAPADQETRQRVIREVLAQHEQTQSQQKTQQKTPQKTPPQPAVKKKAKAGGEPGPAGGRPEPQAQEKQAEDAFEVGRLIIGLAAQQIDVPGALMSTSGVPLSHQAFWALNTEVSALVQAAARGDAASRARLAGRLREMVGKMSFASPSPRDRWRTDLPFCLGWEDPS